MLGFPVPLVWYAFWGVPGSTTSTPLKLLSFEALPTANYASVSQLRSCARRSATGQNHALLPFYG